MYERFTDRSRKVLQLANQEAQILNHEYIGTEHILLGLIKEGSGVAANVMKNLDVDLTKVRGEVEKIVQAGPDIVRMGKLPQTPRTKLVIEYSIDEARQLSHTYVGTEHLLLGLLREREGVAAQVLTNLGLELQEVREEILGLLGCADPNKRVEAPKVFAKARRQSEEKASSTGESLEEMVKRVSSSKSDKNDSFGNRMKMYEGKESDRELIPLLPVMCRIDGRAFHTFTKGMKRPWEERLVDLMISTTSYLTQETNACCGYTQSDEISLCWYAEDHRSQIFFNGRIMKMTSILAAMTSVFFNKHLERFFGLDAVKLEHQNPVFDCRVWNVPNLDEGANTFLWREKDATRNSIQMAAQAVYSHNELMNKNTSQMQEMLFQKGINWNNYDNRLKRGTFIQRHKSKQVVSFTDVEMLPEHHEARKHPDMEFEVTEFRQMDMPPFGKVTNRKEVIFFGADPIVEEE